MTDFRKLNIQGREYALHPMPPVKVARYAPRVIKALSGVLESGKELAKLRDKSEEEAAAMIVPIIRNVDPDDFHALMMEAFAHETFAGGKKLSDPVHFDDWFRANPGDMLPVATWAIWEHVKDFLLGSPAGFQAVFMGAPLKSPTNGSQNTSLEES